MIHVKKKKDRLVLDTSLFVNPEVRHHFGSSPTDAMNGFLQLAGGITCLEFYMPASIFQELMNFVDQKKIPAQLLTIIQQKSPDKHAMTCPAIFIYELVEDMRDRINKGLRIAEKNVRNTAGTEERELIQGMRKQYRDALREGILDSKEDVDLILLAKELDALLVTADNGAIKWADKLGVRWLFPERLKDYLDAYMDNGGECIE